MHIPYSLIAAALMVAGVSAAQAQSASLSPFAPKVLPVLVQVDTLGKITDLSPAVKLTPQLDRLLRQNLDEIISGPATRHGQPVPSQFVANMKLHATLAASGKYATQFVYVSSSPVPIGRWHWAHIDGYRLALVDSDRHRQRPVRHPPIDYRQPASLPAPPPPPLPAVAPSSPPPAAPSPHRGPPWR